MQLGNLNSHSEDRDANSQFLMSNKGSNANDRPLPEHDQLESLQQTRKSMDPAMTSKEKFAFDQIPDRNRASLKEDPREDRSLDQDEPEQRIHANFKNFNSSNLQGF